MITVSSSSFSDRERKYVNDCLDRNWVSQGYYVREFERKFADVCGTKHAIACGSGTFALHLSMLALGVGPETTVAVPALTYVATANVAHYCRARIVFTDIDPESWCMDIEGLDPDVIVLPVHLYDALAPVRCIPNSARIIEDAAHAPGATSGRITTGAMGRIAAFSFYASKIIACGEGGMVTTDDDGLAESVRLYRGQGASTKPGENYVHSVVGYNYRMTDLQAALGLAQTERLPQSLAARRRVVDLYREFLCGSSVQLQGGERASGWMVAVLLPPDVDRSSVAERLYESEIETRPFFRPLPSLPPYRSPVPPVTADVAKRGLCLPTHVELTEQDIGYVCQRLLEVVDEYQELGVAV